MDTPGLGKSGGEFAQAWWGVLLEAVVGVPRFGIATANDVRWENSSLRCQSSKSKEKGRGLEQARRNTCPSPS